MSYCGKCGTQLSEGANFCPKCGTRVSPITSDNCGKSPSRKIVIPLIVSILILAIAGGGWFAWKSYNNSYSLEGLAKALPIYDVDRTEFALCLPDFHEGLASVKKGDKYGFIDKTGKEIIPIIYEYANAFHEGLASVKKGDKYGFIDKTGKEIIPIIYEYANAFQEGLAMVWKDYDGGVKSKYGFIDKTGKEVVPMIYDFANDFHEGLAWVKKGDKYGFIDKTGKEAIPFIYDLANDFHEGLAKVLKGDKYSFIDKAGKEVILITYDNVYASDFREGLAMVRKDEDGGFKSKYGFIDKTGKEVVPMIYDYAHDFNEGLACVKKENKFGFIDKKNKEVIPCIYDGAGDFHEGLAKVSKGGKCGFIDKTGKEIISMIYEGVEDFHEGLAKVAKGKGGGSSDNYGFIDKTGKEIVPCIYSGWANNFSEGLAFVEKDGVLGVIDKKGKTTFDIENEEVKQLVQQKIKEKEEEEERERKRIEEENKPCNKFYNLASQNLFVWEARKHYFDVPGIDVLYFYPTNKTEGYVSVTRQSPDHKSWYPTHSLKTSYRIIGDNSISFSASGLGGLSRKPWSTQYNMNMEVLGDEIKLVNHHSVYGQSVSVTYSQQRIPLQDPLR